jgi:hypothetical protein
VKSPEWTKPAVYGVAVGAVATLIIGFNWGGWVTGGTASEMAAKASQAAQEQLVASICVERFAAAPDAAAKLAALKKTKTWEQDTFVTEGGWIQVDALEEQITGAAGLCADQLIAMESIPARVIEPAAAAAEPLASGG